MSDIDGADLSIKDKAGLTALDYALQRGARWMSIGFQYLLGVRDMKYKVNSRNSNNYGFR